MAKAKDMLGASEEAREAKKVSGSGTAVSGYVDDPTPKKCSTCEYFKKPKLCNNWVVARDPKMKKDKESGLKLVDPENGCCSYWEVEK